MTNTPTPDDLIAVMERKLKLRDAVAGLVLDAISTEEIMRPTDAILALVSPPENGAELRDWLSVQYQTLSSILQSSPSVEEANDALAEFGRLLFERLPELIQALSNQPSQTSGERLRQPHAGTWSPIPSLDGKYEAHPCGAIRQKDGVILGQWLSQQGYPLCRVGSKLDETRTTLRVHRAIAEVFCPNPKNLPCVNHIDNNRSNNDASNLEWCTQQENLQHARDQGRMYSHPKGSASHNRSLSKAQVNQIWALRDEGHSHKQIAILVRTNKKTVTNILTRKTYLEWAPGLPSAPSEES